jgi:ribosomal-protein-alanine N-acetyltransferase
VSRSGRPLAAKLRRGRLGDLDVLLAMERDFFTPDHQISRRGFRHYFRSPKSDLIVADIRGTTAGCALVNYRQNSTMARLYSLAVATDFQRRGLARRLLKEAERKALRRGCRTMRLEVQADDDAAIRLYENAGYRLFGRRPRYYAGRIDALRFEKALATPRRHDAGA